MENRFKMRISRMFRGSFGSCRTAGDLPDVVEKAVFIPQPQKDCYFHLTEDPLPPKTLPFSSICRPKCPETTTKAISDSIFPRKKISGRYPPFVSTDTNGHTYCPPVSPTSPLNPFYKNPKKTKKNNNIYARRNVFSSSSQDSAYFDGTYWFSSDEEGDTLFSSRSTLSSDSSGSGFQSRRYRRKKHSRRRRRRKTGKKDSEMGVLGKVKDSFAVVKRSSDPYNDFRTSMVEMIVEKQIFSAYDLEQLLQCFLSLNSDHHHRIIVEVFTEIYEALFSNSS